MDAAVTSAVWIKLESRFTDRPVDRDEIWNDVGGASFFGDINLRIIKRAGSTDIGLGVAACTTVQVEPRSQTGFRIGDQVLTLDGLDLLERHQAGVEKESLKEGEIIKRSSRTRRVAANSRICGHEAGIQADRRAEQQERKNRTGDSHLNGHRCPPWWDMADTKSLVRHNYPSLIFLPKPSKVRNDITK